MLIGICGASGSGKTAISRMLAQKLDACVISSDAYYKPINQIAGFRQWHYDSPFAINYAKLQQHIELALTLQPIQIPNYDFKQSRVVGSTLTQSKPHIIIEGLHWMANPWLRKHCDFVIEIRTDLQKILLRRLARDTQQRGSNVKRFMQNYQKHVLAAYQRFWMPLHRTAAYYVVNDNNDISLLCNELHNRVSLNLLRVA